MRYAPRKWFHLFAGRDEDPTRQLMKAPIAQNKHGQPGLQIAVSDRNFSLFDHRPENA